MKTIETSTLHVNNNSFTRPLITRDFREPLESSCCSHIEDRGFMSFADNMIKLSVNKTK